MQQDAISASILNQDTRHTLEGKLHWLFRLALLCEFVGHGAFGVLTKPVWVPYFGLFSIPEAWAWKLMPIVGSADIALGMLAFVAPMRAYRHQMHHRSIRVHEQTSPTYPSEE
jgi:hypothetical protein